MGMQQEVLFPFLTQNAIEIIFTFDSMGVILYANEAANLELGYEGELEGYNISEIFPNDFTRTTKGFETEYVMGQLEQQLTAYRGNRTCFPMRTRMQQYSQEPIRYICMGMNVSQGMLFEKEVAKAEQEMEAALKIKSEFIANVTHELRTPVNGILGNAKELAKIEDDEKKLRLLRLIEQGCENMNAIINSVLDFSKLEAGKFTLEPQKFHFRNMIEYVRSNHINKITEKGLELFITVSPDVPEYIVGDELRIVQILNNLLSNATKFTAVGKIAVEVVKTAQYDNRMELFFMVIDSGIGIDKAEQDKLFKSFSQVDASISRRYGGTGLGLNISKQLVELMNGNIRVESELGKGTMFSFYIWVGVDPDASKNLEEVVTDTSTIMNRLNSFTESEDSEKIWTYGEAENIEEIKKKMSKLILSIEMDNWEKAEMFVETLRQLTEDAPKEVKTAMLRLKMAVQKENYEKSIGAFENLQEII